MQKVSNNVIKMTKMLILTIVHEASDFSVVKNQLNALICFQSFSM